MAATWEEFIEYSYIEQEDKIEWLTDRIQPFVMFKMPDGGWIEYPLGIFLMSAPVKVEEGDYIYRNVEAYDGLVILDQDKFTERYTLKAGTRYDEAVIGILKTAGIRKYNIQESDKAMANDIEFEPGTAKINAINELLDAINYTSLWVDEWGYFTSSRYIQPSDRDYDYEYMDDEMSVIKKGISEEMDLFSVPNKWLVTYENVDGGEDEKVFLQSIYENNSEDSPTSIVNLGRTIVDYRTIDEIADQEALDEYTKRIANEASQIYEKIKFSTAVMPFHANMDIIRIRNMTLGIDGNYTETSWKIPLQVGASMEHEGRKVVNI